MEQLDCCCDEKKRLLSKNRFLNRLSIVPDVIIFQKHEKCRSYKKKFEIKNEDICNIKVTITSDFPNELGFKTDTDFIIDAQSGKTVYVQYEPTETSLRKDTGNRRFSIFIGFQHPQLTLEVPILLYRKSPDLCIPKQILFPMCSLYLPSYYCMTIYNPCKKAAIFLTKWISKSPYLQLLSNINQFDANSCTRLLFSVTAQNDCSICDELLIISDCNYLLKYLGGKYRVSFSNEIVSYQPHISNYKIHFPRVYFGFSSDECFKVCNESREAIEIKWCRKERQECDPSDNEKETYSRNIKEINENFVIEPKSAKIPPNSSLQIRATFIPKPNLSDVETVDLKFKSYAYLACSTNNNIRLPVKLSGAAIGPNITLNFCHLELGNVFIGEKRCIRVKANNNSRIPGTIKFIDSDKCFGGVTLCTPHYYTLDPGQEETFVLNYYSTNLGKFSEKIMFRVEYGKSVYLTISGTTEPIHVIPIPKTIDFGKVYICSLQRKDLCIRNPLSTAILVSFTSENDGVQEPMIITNFEDFVEGFQSDEDENGDPESVQPKFKECNPPLLNPSGFLIDSTSSLSLPWTQSDDTSANGSGIEQSVSTSTSKSSRFFDAVAEATDVLTGSILNKQEVMKTVEDPYPDLRILESIVGDLLKMEYFQPLAELADNHRRQMKLPNAPREYLFKPETIEIKAFESKTVPIFLAPNKSGRTSAHLKLKVSIINDEDNSTVRQDVKNETFVILPEDAITTIVTMTHNCLVPEIEIKTDFKIECGIDLPKRLELIIVNKINVPGVVVINFSKTNKADIACKPKKFVLKASGTVNVELKISNRVIGNSLLTGEVEVFGSTRRYPINIECHTEPPKVKIHVSPITYEGKVLVRDAYMTYIQNLGNGLVQYQTRLKSGISIECNAGSGYVYPNECKEICLLTYFYDPGFYKDILSIDVKHLNTINVPVKVNIKGLPIKFKPNILPTFNLNLIATSLKPYVTPITIENHGKNNYTVHISRKHRSTNEEEKSKFEFKVNSFSLDSNESCDAELYLTRKDPMFLKQEFYVDATELLTRKRISGFVFVVEVNLIDTKLQWNRQRLNFQFRNSDFYEMSIGESVTLKNKSELIENVTLEVVGNFEIFDPIKQTFWNKYKFQLEPFGSKDLIIRFDAKEINQCNQDVEYEGKIFVVTPEKSHKLLPLFCKIIFPIVTLPMPTIRYYSLSAFPTSFSIENPGDMLAFYQWSYQGTPHKIQRIVNKNFQNIWTYLASFESTGLSSSPVDIEQEWMVSFKRFLEYDSDDDAVVEEEEKASLEIFQEPQQLDQENESKLDLKSVRSKTKTKKNKKSEKKKMVDKLDSPLNKSACSSMKSSKSRKKSKIIEEPTPTVEKPKPPQFICKESKLQVEIDEVINKIYDLFYIDDKGCKYHGRQPEPDDLYTMAKLHNVLIEPDTQTEMYFILDHYRGSIPPHSQKKLHVYFAGDSEDVEIKSTLVMNVVGGRSEELNMEICTADTEVEISKSSFNLETQPWYKINYFKINVKNTNLNSVQITPLLNEYQRKDKRLVCGYIEVRPNQSFILAPETRTQFLVAAFVGMNQNFLDAFGIEVNSGIPANIQFKGRARIPMISILNLERLPTGDMTIEQEYLFLNNIFLKQIIYIVPKQTAVSDEEIMLIKHEIGANDPEEVEVKIERIETIQTESTHLEAKSPERSQSDESVKRLPETPKVEIKGCNPTVEVISPQIEKNIFKVTHKKESPNMKNSDYLEQQFHLKMNKLAITERNTIDLALFPKKLKFRGAAMEIADPDLADYCVIDYPEEYPSALQLHHIMEVQRFQNEIVKRTTAWKNYLKIVKKYVLRDMDVEKYNFKEKKFEQPIRPTSFKIQSLPYYSTSYKLDFGTLYLEESKDWIFELFYHGPGKVYFLIRTLFVIPGMKISILAPDFQCDGSNGDFKFTIYNYALVPRDNCKYRNIQSRSTEEIRSIQSDCGECTGKKFCHAHSFDFNEKLIHTRNVKVVNRRAVNEFYSWWNRPEKEIKDPYIHCELFQERLANTENKIFKFKIQFRPSSKYYNNPTPFEDFIYIDIHMGPTIPILIQGTIAAPEMQTSKSTKSD